MVTGRDGESGRGGGGDDAPDEGRERQRFTAWYVL